MTQENTSVDFNLQGIKTEQFAVFEESYKAKSDPGLGTQLQFKIDRKNKLVGCFLGFEFVEGKNVFLKIVVSCHFKIMDDSWNRFTQLDNKKIVIPKDFLSHLAMITTGTTRGVLFAKTETTLFSKFIIPTLNVKEMIAEDATFDLSV